jgi:hypothetical protein
MLVHDVQDPFAERDGSPNLLCALDSLPPVSSLIKSEPSPLLRFSLVNIMYAAAFYHDSFQATAFFRGWMSSNCIFQPTAACCHVLCVVCSYAYSFAYASIGHFDFANDEDSVSKLLVGVSGVLSRNDTFQDTASALSAAMENAMQVSFCVCVCALQPALTVYHVRISEYL